MLHVFNIKIKYKRVFIFQCYNLTFENCVELKYLIHIINRNRRV